MYEQNQPFYLEESKPLSGIDGKCHTRYYISKLANLFFLYHDYYFQDGTTDGCLVVLVHIVLSSFVCKLSFLLDTPSSFTREEREEREQTISLKPPIPLMICTWTTT